MNPIQWSTVAFLVQFGVAIAGALIVVAAYKKAQVDALKSTIDNQKGYIDSLKGLLDENKRKLEKSESDVATAKFQVDQIQREVFAISVEMERVRKENTRLGVKVLEQQDQLDKLTRWRRRVTDYLEHQGHEVPPLDGEEEE